MVERAETSDPRWAEVDAYAADRLLGDDSVLARVLAANAAAGLPDIDVWPDNVVREGGVLDGASEDDRIRGTRALFDAVAAEPRLRATAVQTVGVKKCDASLLAIVVA